MTLAQCTVMGIETLLGVVGVLSLMTTEVDTDATVTPVMWTMAAMLSAF